MTEDITSLQIRILYDQVTEAERRLRTLTTTGEKSRKEMGNQGKAADSLMGKMARLALGYVSLRTVMGGFSAIIKTTAEFQQLNAQLVTAVGSSDKAKIAFGAIKDFAQKTPYDLKQATEAFISLVNRGLNPSERAMTSYGNTASSMGRSLADMVLAVSNATTGEYENLKTFGIRAAKVGTDVQFTFKGITTTVKNNAKDIENYFIGLGEKNFAGGMERQMETLNGAFSNFGDAWDIMLNSIGEHGLGDVVEETVRQATTALGQFTDMINSGEISARIEAWGTRFHGLGEDAKNAFDTMGGALAWVIDNMDSMLDEHKSAIEQKARDPWDTVLEKMGTVPAGCSAMVRLMVGDLEFLSIKIGGIVKDVQNMFADFGSQTTFFLSTFNNQKGIAAPPGLEGTGPWAGTASAGSLATANLSGVRDVQSGQRDIDTLMQENARADLEALEQSVATSYYDAVDTAVLQDKGAIKLTDQYNADKAKRDAANAGKDRLAQFAIPGGGGAAGAAGGGSGGGSKAGKLSEFDRLAKELGDEEKLIEESYRRRLELIENNTRAGSLYQAELEISLTEKFVEEQQKRIDALKQEPATYREAMSQELELIAQSYDLRKQIILEAVETTENEKAALMEKLNKDHAAQLRKHWTEEVETQTSGWASLFESFQTIGNSYGKKGFEMAKAASIALATVKGIEAAISSYAAGAKIGGPYVGAAFAVVSAAATGAQIGALNATEYSGSYAGGGIVGGNSFSGDALTARVNSGEMVLNANQQRSLFNMANGGGGGGGTVVNIHNSTGAKVETKESTVGDRKIVDIMIGEAKRQLAEDIRKGGTGVSAAIEQTYKIRR